MEMQFYCLEVTSRLRERRVAHLFNSCKGSHDLKPSGFLICLRFRLSDTSLSLDRISVKKIVSDNGL